VHADHQLADFPGVAEIRPGLDGDGVVLEDVLKAHLSRDDQEVRETAALALGITGRKQAVPILASLLANGRVRTREGEREKARARWTQREMRIRG